MRKPKLRTLVQALAFHLANLLGMDEDNEETVKKYHSLIDEYEVLMLAAYNKPEEDS